MICWKFGSFSPSARGLKKWRSRITAWWRSRSSLTNPCQAPSGKMSSRLTHSTCSELVNCSHHPDQAATEHRDQLCGAIDVVIADRKKIDPGGSLGVGGDHGARRVGARISARSLRVGDTDPAVHIDALLADALVSLAFRAQPDHELIALQLVQVVEPDRHLELDRQRVGDIDQRVYPRQRLAPLEPAEQRLRRRPHPRRVEPETAVKLTRPAHCADLARPAGLDRPCHLELEVLAWWRDLELIKLETVQLDVDLASNFQHRYSR